MTHLGAGTPRRKHGHYLFSLVVLIVAAIAIVWAMGALFPVELHQIAQWLQVKFEALRR
jgi:hypothetical protein